MHETTGDYKMSHEVRVIPIEYKIASTSAYAYYIDTPEPSLIDTGIATSVSQEIESVLVENGNALEILGEFY